MNQWPEYYEYLRTGDCSIDIRDDTPSSVSSSSSSSLSSAAAVTSSSCTNDVNSGSAGGHVVALVRNGLDIYRKPVLGLKKCFHCPNCRYSTDRKNNLKRHLGTMHRDHYVAGVMELDQSSYHVSVQRRASFQSRGENCDFNRRSLNKRQVATVLPDDFVRSDDVSKTRTDDVNTYRSEDGTQPLHTLIITENDDVNTLAHAYSQPLSPSSSPTATQTDDVNTNHSVAGTQPQLPSSYTTRNDDVKTYQTTQNGDVSTYRCEDGTQPFPPSPINDYRNSFPEFEPRPATAYRRHSSRMFFYDRLRCTHDYNDTDHSA